MKAYSIIVSGKVQGVGFRRSVQRKAWQFGIVGEVRNLEDGTVEILAQGEQEKLGEFVGSLSSIELPAEIEEVKKTATKILKKRRAFKIIHGKIEDELDEGLGVGQEQLALLRKDLKKFSEATSSSFDNLATRYDKISNSLEILTRQTKQFTDSMTTLTQLAREYFNQRKPNEDVR